MSSAPKIPLETIFKRCGYIPNPDQKRAISHTKGPLLIIAGPGSGKTEVLIYRALNLILCKDVKPENILLCTFTEKAAEQLKARLKLYLTKCGREDIDLSKMSVGTIHSICNAIIQDHINRIPNLHKNYEVLEELTQTLFPQPFYPANCPYRWCGGYSGKSPGIAPRQFTYSPA